MPWTFFSSIVERVRTLVGRRAVEQDFDQELDTHLRLAEEDKVRRGMSPEEARRIARIELGGLSQLREEARAARGFAWLGAYWLDVKLGLRMLRKSWGLTLVGGLAMVVTMALGATIFTAYKTLSGTSVPLDEGDRIVAIQSFDLAAQSVQRQSPPEDFRRWRETLRSVTDVSALRTTKHIMIAPEGSAGEEPVAEMTASAFQLARVRPLKGRPVIEADERDGAEPVAVIGYDLWQSGFSSDADILGRKLQLDGVSHTVVGVMPKDYLFPVHHRVWTALRSHPLGSAPVPKVFVFARLAAGSTQQGAQAEVQSRGMLASSTISGSRAHLRPRVVPYVAGYFSDIPDSGWVGGVILFVVTLLLVPPCANIAILVYARTVTRQEEFAAPYTLGAIRSRIVAQIFLELLVLAFAAGVAAFLLARQFGWQLSRMALPGMGPQNMPFWMDFRPSFQTGLCVAALTVVAAALSGGVPALQATGRWWRSGLQALGKRHGHGARQDVDRAACGSGRPGSGNPSFGDAVDVGDLPAKLAGFRVCQQGVHDRLADDGGK